MPVHEITSRLCAGTVCMPVQYVLSVRAVCSTERLDQLPLPEVHATPLFQIILCFF